MTRGGLYLALLAYVKLVDNMIATSKNEAQHHEGALRARRWAYEEERNPFTEQDKNFLLSLRQEDLQMDVSDDHMMMAVTRMMIYDKSIDALYSPSANVTEETTVLYERYASYFIFARHVFHHVRVGQRYLNRSIKAYPRASWFACLSASYPSIPGNSRPSKLCMCQQPASYC